MKLLIDGTVLSTPEINRGIGKVFIGLLSGMLRLAPYHEYLLLYFEDSDLDNLGPWERSIVTPIKIDRPAAHPGYKAGSAAYADIISDVIDSHKPDIYWNANPLMTNAYFPVGLKNCLTAATLFDVIPYVLKKDYLEQWPKEISEGYISKLREMKLNTDLILGISKDAVNTFDKVRYKRGDNRLVNGYISCNEDIFWPSEFSKPSNDDDRKYILLVGGDDPRKNMDLVVSGFGAFVANEQTEKYDLLITSRLSEKTQDRLMQLAKESGVENNVKLTGYISDHLLAEYYREAEFSVFPSVYEGFGLPILESLRCGTYVCSSKIPTSVEIGEDFTTYFKDFTPEAVAAAMSKAAKVVSSESELSQKCIAQASSFSWEQTAQTYLNEFLNLCVTPQNRAAATKPKIAMLTPWPEHRSGIADYCYSAAQSLKDIAKVQVFHPTGSAGTEMKPLTGIKISPISAIKKSRTQFDGYIVHLGNNTEFHKELYEWVLDNPAKKPLIVLHDVNIHPFMQHGYLFEDQKDIFLNALSSEAKPEDMEALKANLEKGINPGIWDYPMSAHLLNYGPVLLHNQASRSKLNRASQSESAHKVHVLPLAANNADTDVENTQKLNWDICAFGYINSNKRPAVSMEAFGKLRALGLPVRLTFVGKLNDKSVDIQALKEKFLDPEDYDKVNVTGFVSDDVFQEYLRNADIVWNLRFPSMGESSATLHEALAGSKAVIVNNYDQFNEYPDDVLWKVNLGEDELDELTSLTHHLLVNEEVRRALGNNAKTWSQTVLSFEKTAETYVKLATEAT